jgi:hypothetical protein
MFLRFIKWLASKLQERVIENEEGIYLLRYLVRGWSPQNNVAVSWSAYLHNFKQYDMDPCVHNHPWKWCISIILNGGYTEQRLTRTGQFIERRLTRFSINLFRGDTFHRISSLEGDPWTLFIVGPKVSGWGFWVNNEFVDWRTRLRSRGITPSY